MWRAKNNEVHQPADLRGADTTANITEIRSVEGEHAPVWKRYLSFEIQFSKVLTLSFHCRVSSRHSTCIQAESTNFKRSLTVGFFFQYCYIDSAGAWRKTLSNGAS